MDDTVSRRKAVEALRVAYWDYDIQSTKDDPCVVDAMTDWAIRQIKALPTAEPKIVRCQDCDWWLKQPNSAQGRCALFGIYPTGSWYCANARKRGDA